MQHYEWECQDKRCEQDSQWILDHYPLLSSSLPVRYPPSCASSWLFLTLIPPFFSHPYGGKVDHQHVWGVTRELLDMGCYEVSFGFAKGKSHE